VFRGRIIFESYANEITHFVTKELTLRRVDVRTLLCYLREHGKSAQAQLGEFRAHQERYAYPD
jgi:hypothetical protein